MLKKQDCNQTGASPDWPVDLVHLSKYTLGDRELEREVLQLFRCQSRIYLDRLRDAKDAKNVHDIAHTIKGSAQSVGAWRVRDCAQVAEEIGNKVGQPAMARAVMELDEAISEADAYILSLGEQG